MRLSKDDKDLIIEAVYVFAVLQSMSFQLPLHPHAMQDVYEYVQNVILVYMDSARCAHTHTCTDTVTVTERDPDTHKATDTYSETGRDREESSNTDNTDTHRDTDTVTHTVTNPHTVTDTHTEESRSANKSVSQMRYAESTAHMKAVILSMQEVPAYTARCEHYADVASEFKFRVELYMARTPSGLVLTPPLSSYAVSTICPSSPLQNPKNEIEIINFGEDIDNETSNYEVESENEISKMILLDDYDYDDIYSHCGNDNSHNNDQNGNNINDTRNDVNKYNTKNEINGNDEKEDGDDDEDEDDDDDDAFQDIKTIQITPSNIICKPANYMKTSRLIRAVSKLYHLVYVHLRDEAGESIYHHEIYDQRYKQFFENGICGPWVQGLELNFLMCSGSQMRQQSAIFILGTKDDVLKVRSMFLPYEEKRNLSICKYVSGLGLFCTADHPLVDLSKSENSTIEHPVLLPDTYTMDGSKLTDGAAMISREYMQELAVSRPDLFPNTDCSAIQIRYRGDKGVVSVSPHVKGRTIQFRESNYKFYSLHKVLCFVKGADYNKLNVNRDVLNLLSCLGEEGVAGGDWNPLSSLLRMQENELSRLANSLINHADANRVLHVHLYGQSALLDKYSDINVDFTIEPFFRLCVLQVYEHAVRTLRTKTHIPVNLGALLMGIPDPYDVLKEGEIFFQIRKRGSDSIECITGNVLMYRNPCLHPGDVRVVTAVHSTALSQYVNVLLLPARHSMTRSLSAECSGGDLDGDHFALIWDKNLVPPVHRLCPPMDYNSFAIACKKKQEENEEESGLKTERTEIGYMMDGMRTSLGKVARLHLAVCDILPNGALEPLSIRIAEQASVAVDFPKTGVAATLPREGRAA
jgi:RNA dependent RNA polymerase